MHAHLHRTFRSMNYQLIVILAGGWLHALSAFIKKIDLSAYSIMLDSSGACIWSRDLLADDISAWDCPISLPLKNTWAIVGYSTFTATSGSASRRMALWGCPPGTELMCDLQTATSEVTMSLYHPCAGLLSVLTTLSEVTLGLIFRCVSQ